MYQEPDNLSCENVATFNFLVLWKDIFFSKVCLSKKQNCQIACIQTICIYLLCGLIKVVNLSVSQFSFLSNKKWYYLADSWQIEWVYLYEIFTQILQISYCS